ncbi:uncharacterized protein MELLADRAFT_89339 [Melampsora larici-populina 98AG31]|uniref:CxC1-like cysteine cluster associated with KDZ transposases domain-containing protein n=1 Tax=Melampsora larici-populina (strain 98AG31 / pathotype 3-4-7) TaxID=747676 RepID=F4R5T0_MELLP|nr:uncharacterized protein MELLADRAFT_89339 [Melampsora larici-populina 98AG31]EGG12093.1 hypothetical protein MELLADRAFT_89339 [Melampsora larici-populina 98AG31]
MPQKGRSIPCPLGPSKKTRTARPPKGSAQIVAEVTASGSQWVRNRTQEIERALAETPAAKMQVHQPENNIEIIASSDDNNSADDPPEQMGNHFDHSLPTADALPPNVDVTLGDYIRGSYYKKKQLAEAKNWEKMLNPMFLAYMSLARKGSQWGDPRLWNVDHNIPCSCGVAATRTRPVDMVDILGRSRAIIFP